VASWTWSSVKMGSIKTEARIGPLAHDDDAGGGDGLSANKLDDAAHANNRTANTTSITASSIHEGKRLPSSNTIIK
jgi:hypothetical protein